MLAAGRSREHVAVHRGHVRHLLRAHVMHAPRPERVRLADLGIGLADGSVQHRHDHGIVAGNVDVAAHLRHAMREAGRGW